MYMTDLRHVGTTSCLLFPTCLWTSQADQVINDDAYMTSPTGSFSCKSNSFSYEKFCTRTPFETEAQGDSKMTYWYQKQQTLISMHFTMVLKFLIIISSERVKSKTEPKQDNPGLIVKAPSSKTALKMRRENDSGITQCSWLWLLTKMTVASGNEIALFISFLLVHEDLRQQTAILIIQ